MPEERDGSWRYQSPVWHWVPAKDRRGAGLCGEFVAENAPDDRTDDDGHPDNCGKCRELLAARRAAAKGGAK